MTSETDIVNVLPKQNDKYNSSTREEGLDTTCGIGGFKPRFLQMFACIGSFVGFYSGPGLLTSSLSVYVNSQVSMLEKQFGFSSSQSGLLMACNDIGFLSCALFTGYLAKKVHIPRGLGVSTILFGICGILCAFPYFLQDKSVFDLDDQPAMGKTNITQVMSKSNKVPMCDLSNSTGSSMNACSVSSKGGAYNLDQLWLKRMAFALIAIGMVLQGIGKSPRIPFVTLYIDDAVTKKKTGFYFGIIGGTAVFGPSMAFLLGGAFSKTYVTLESVNISPRDPRWIGAWWLGFLVFGACSICFSLPLMCFPRNLRSRKRQMEDEMLERNIEPTPVKNRSTSGLVVHEAKEFTRSIIRILSSPAYVLLTLSSIMIVCGLAGTIAFKSKYIADQYSIPLWKANLIMACTTTIASSLGMFLGGVITRRVKMTPLTVCKLMILFNAVHLAAQTSGIFLGCNQPQLIGDNQHRTPSPHYKLTESACSTNCDCDEGRYFPICGDDGRSYFSPCHAGCTEITLREFTNCTCIATGLATSGLCDQGCTTKLYIYAVIIFIGILFGFSKVMPSYIGELRAVEERDRAMGQAFQGFVNSCLGWMLGPVIFGAFIDNTCAHWKYACGERQSCAIYDIEHFRILLHSFVIICSGIATLLIVFLYAYFKVIGKNQWKFDEDRMNELQL